MNTNANATADNIVYVGSQTEGRMVTVNGRLMAQSINKSSKAGTIIIHRLYLSPEGEWTFYSLNVTATDYPELTGTLGESACVVTDTEFALNADSRPQGFLIDHKGLGFNAIYRCGDQKLALAAITRWREQAANPLHHGKNEQNSAA